MDMVKNQLDGDHTREKEDQMRIHHHQKAWECPTIKGERSPKTVCNNLFFLKLLIFCAIGKRKREDSGQSKRGIDIYLMKQRHYTSPERDSESHDISHGRDKEPAGRRPYKRKGKESTRWKLHKKRKDYL